MKVPASLRLAKFCVVSPSLAVTNVIAHAANVLLQLRMEEVAH
jgi:hypothetical protein